MCIKTGNEAILIKFECEEVLKYYNLVLNILCIMICDVINYTVLEAAT